ncbi:hypothetical protein FCZ50_25130 [Escherichia coli]|nr:hypothetical protein [Escherichia coli]
MTKNTRFSPEVRQRAVRMVLESQGEYDSQWAAICSIAPKIGCTPETLRVWVRQHERKRLVRTVLIFTESSDQLSRATDRVPGLPASPGYVQ